ncbi:MAG TPA: hypothetical protein ENN40_06590 [Candidatus Aminicenantes bacterium]|nr:hypothetical protein [Candidatus Aminicenantes bacterium]
MKEPSRNWFPAGLAAFTLVVALLAYPSTGAGTNFTTAIMAAGACLGWAAIILFLHGRRRTLIAHLVVAMAVPLCTRLMPGFFPWEPYRHWYLYGLMLFSFLGLILFVRTQKPYQP